ncbi:hypothetical protein T06_12983 [Trichinella sp. T6]|nr:hypothetical protein T06_12983 [Trichinella sp. T6]
MKVMLKSGITLVSDQSGPTENGKQQFSPQTTHNDVTCHAFGFEQSNKILGMCKFFINLFRNERYIFVETFRNFKEKYATIHQWNDPKLLHIFLLIFKACACCRVYHVKQFRRQDECETMKR